jgi:hypothetical protein
MCGLGNLNTWNELDKLTWFCASGPKKKPLQEERSESGNEEGAALIVVRERFHGRLYRYGKRGL